MDTGGDDAEDDDVAPSDASLTPSSACGASGFTAKLTRVALTPGVLAYLDSVHAAAMSLILSSTLNAVHRHDDGDGDDDGEADGDDHHHVGDDDDRDAFDGSWQQHQQPSSHDEDAAPTPPTRANSGPTPQDRQSLYADDTGTHPKPQTSNLDP